MTQPFRAVGTSAAGSASCGKKRRLSGLAAPFFYPRAVKPCVILSSSRNSPLLPADDTLDALNHRLHSPPLPTGRGLDNEDNSRPIANILPNGETFNSLDYVASMRDLNNPGQGGCDFQPTNTTTTTATDRVVSKADDINVPDNDRVGDTVNNPIIINNSDKDNNGDGNIEKPARVLSSVMKAMKQLNGCKGFKFEYTVEGQIGVGTYGVVLAIRSRFSKKPYAIKVAITRPGQKFNASIREFVAMEKFVHKNVVCFHQSFDATSEGIPTKILILNLANRGDLESFIYNRHNGSGYHPNMAVSITKQMLEGLGYIHWKNFAHCDFKPGNMLVSLKDGADMPCIQIADLGGVVELDPQGCLSEYYGTHATNAPEVFDLRSGHIDRIKGHCADMWSLGCTVYFLVTGGCYPFDGPSGEYDEAASKYNTRNGLLEWRDNLQVKNPYRAQFFINSLLSMDPEHRFNCKVMLQHQWLCEDQGLPDLLVLPPLRTKGSDWPIIWEPNQDDEGNTEEYFVEGSACSPEAL